MANCTANKDIPDFSNAHACETTTAGADAEKKAPLSKLIEFLICLTMFNEGVQMHLIYPLLHSTVAFYLTNSIGAEEAAKKIGLYCGILTAVYYGAAGLSGILYGTFADRFGRRRALLGGLLGSTFAALVFAFSTNYWMALTARFLTGFLDSNLAMLKAYIGDVTDHTNQSRVFSNAMFMFALAVTLAPLVSGSLPGSFFPGTMTWLPVFWPCMVSALCTTLIGCACYVHLPETASFKNRQLRLQRGIPDETPVAKTSDDHEEVQLSFFHKYYAEIMAMIFYVLMSWVLFGCDSVFPLLVQDSTGHGLGLPKSWTGYYLVAQGATWCVFQLAGFGPMVHRIGAINVFRFGSLMLSLGAFAVYVPVLLDEPYRTAFMFFAVTIRGIALATSFTSIVMIVNNSSTTATKGRITGLAHSLSSAARMVGVLVVSSLWDIGLSNHFAFLPFLVAGSIAAFMLVISLLLPESLNKPKPEPLAPSTVSQKV